MSTRGLTWWAIAFLSMGMALHASWLLSRSEGIPGSNALTCESIDLGAIEQGAKPTFAFRVVNPTSQEVTVREVTPSCGCTWLSEVKGMRVASHGELAIHGTLDLEQQRGRIDSHAVLTYQLGSSPIIRSLVMTVRADVHSLIRAKPEPVHFEIESGNRSPISRMVELDSERLDSFELIDVIPSSRWITAKLVQPHYRKQGAAVRPAQVKITVTAPSSGEEYWLSSSEHQSVTIRTSVESAKTVVLPIRVKRS